MTISISNKIDSEQRKLLQRWILPNIKESIHQKVKATLNVYISGNGPPKKTHEAKVDIIEIHNYPWGLQQHIVKN